MVTFISSFVFAGVMSAYIFLGRGLARQVNAEGLESRTRLALFTLSTDVSSAAGISAQNPGVGVSGNQMTLYFPDTTSAVYSCDWSVPNSGRLIRTSSNGQTLVLLTNLTGFAFQYFDGTTTAVTVPATAPASPQVDIKQVCMTYTSSAGYAPSGNLSNFTVVSPLLVMKNKTLLQDPLEPSSP